MARHRIKIIIVLFSIVVGLLGFGAYHLLSSPTWWASMIKKNINQQPKERLFCRDLTIDKVAINWRQGILTFQGLKVKLKVSGLSYFISTEDINIYNLYQFLKTKQVSLLVDLNQVALIGSDFSVSNLNIKSLMSLNEYRFNNLSLDLSAREVIFNKLSFNDLTAQIKSDIKQFKISSAQFHFLNGEVKTDSIININDKFTYSINGVLNNLDLSLLSYSFPVVSDQVSGVIKGRFQLTVQDSKIINFREKFTSDNGVNINSNLLKKVIQYLPQAQQVFSALAEDQKIFFELAGIETTTSKDEVFSSQITLNSSKLNLKTSIIADVKFEGGVKKVLDDAGLLGGFNEFYMLIKLFNSDYGLHR